MDELPLDKVMDLLLDTVCVVDEQGRYVHVSASVRDLLGYEPEELIGRNMIDLVHPDDRERTLAAAGDIMAGRPKIHFQNRYVRKDGRVVDIMWSARWSENDRLRLAVARDITALKRAERLQSAVYRIAEAAHAADGLPALYRQIHRIIGDWLPSEVFCVALLGGDEDAVEFPYCAGKSGAPCHAGPLEADSALAHVIHTGEALLASVKGEGETGDWLGVPLSTPAGVIGALVVESPPGHPRFTSTDKELLEFVSTQVAAAIERKQAEARLQHMARHDPLTDLPNRALFHDRLSVALSRARRDDENLALLYIDLNDFKDINDDFGHATGDRVLQEIARRLTDCVRQSDTVARMGGDEFTVLLTNIKRAEDVPGIVDKVRRSITEPLSIGDARLVITASIGSAAFPDDGRDSEPLLRQADAQMYADKDNQTA
jgi:diguanylate cyclase (GGDEF)-like protein/PAS domain S-box-containing protein